LNGVCGGTDHVEHEARVGQHGNVAAVGLIRGVGKTTIVFNLAIVLASWVPDLRDWDGLATDGDEL
jgi:hypothetical protein